jgi:hypothetical protein
MGCARRDGFPTNIQFGKIPLNKFEQFFVFFEGVKLRESSSSMTCRGFASGGVASMSQRTVIAVEQ